MPNFLIQYNTNDNPKITLITIPVQMSQYSMPTLSMMTFYFRTELASDRDIHYKNTKIVRRCWIVNTPAQVDGTTCLAQKRLTTHGAQALGAARAVLPPHGKSSENQHRL